MQLGNGRWETAEYNNRGQITEIGLGTTDSTQNLLMLELDYGTNTQNNGSLREQTITVPTIGGTSGFTAIQTYTYDDLNRIQSATEMIGVTETWKQTFTIDRYGNRRFNTTSNLTTTLGSCTEAVCNPTISTANNRFTSDGYDYDENGNLIEDAQGQRFIYDAENHQTGYFDASNSGSTPDATYTYDGEGKRVINISSTETTVFVYNASGQLVAEYSTQISQAPQVSYLTTDHLGSPRVITNQDGNVTSRKDYTAFGEENVTTERETELGYAGQSETRKGYTGYEKDDESGLDFAQARYYNSTHGRFTSVDPLTASASIKNPQTFNRYSYVLNSPYKYTDPLGLVPLGSSDDNGHCGAENATCDNIPNMFWNETEVSWEDEQEETDDGIAASHESAHGGQQQAQGPALPYCPGGHMCFGEQAGASRAADAGATNGTLDVPDDGPGVDLYNCFAWAVGFTDRWIQGSGKYGDSGWGLLVRFGGENGPSEYLFGTESVMYKPETFPKAFGGKKTDANTTLDSGRYRLMVIDDKNNPDLWHVMRQDSSTGLWSSKNGAYGRWRDIKDPTAFYNASFSGLRTNAKADLRITYYSMPNKLILPKK